MDNDFWHERWQAGQVGFHQDRVNPFLERHWAKLGVPAGSRVLVPLCGKSLDLLWLRKQDYMVTGIELSPLAIDAFFAEHGLTPQRHTRHGHACWSADNIELVCADFFSVSRGELGEVAACYDRAALIALPAPMRRRYAHQLRELLPPGTPGLLITLQYPAAEMNGPPFPVGQDELWRLFGPDCALQNLETADMLAENPSLQARGLSSLSESAWLLHYQAPIL